MSYFVITLVQLQLEIRDKKEISAQVNQQYQSQQLENDELQQILDNGDASKYIERVARDVLGYVLPGERVYYDTSSGN
ncbi:MAG: septum formation initiator family protein [Oscillospiraceae bacterium]